MSVDNLKGYAVAIGALAVIDLVSIAIVLGYGTTSLFGARANQTYCDYGTNASTSDCQLFAISNNYVTGLTIFATFVGVIILALIGKVIVSLYKGE